MRELYHPKRSEIELTAVMHALSDPTRLSIVRQLADGEEQACGTFAVDVAKSTLSQHFKVLRDSGVVRTRVDGTTAVADAAPRRPGRPLPRPARRDRRSRPRRRPASGEGRFAEGLTGDSGAITTSLNGRRIG